MSGTQVSSFPDQNILFNAASGLATANVQRNQLLNQAEQQTINANEMEQISRASNWVLSQDPENKDPAKQASAYSTAVKLLQANGFAKNAPQAYPGFDAMQGFARMGTPSKDLYQQTQDRAALAALAPAATPGSPAPAAGGGGGDFSSDKETARKQIVARESGGDPTALNYVARQDPTAIARGATASGKYQFVNSTWREGLQLAGLDPAQYATARDAPEKVQDQVFDAVYAKYGTKPWQQGPRDWVKDEQGQYQMATVRPPPGSPGGAPVTAAAAPPGGGVVARNPGAVQVAGPGAGAPAAPAAPPAATDLVGPRPLPPIGPGSPVVTPQSLANTPAPQNALAPPPPPAAPAVAAPAAAPPAAPAPPAAAQPPQVALPPRPPIGQDGLQDYQRQELRQLAALGHISPADFIARQEQMKSHNDTLLQQWQTEVRQAQNDALTRQDKATTQAREAEQLRLSQKSDARAEAEAKRAGLPTGYRLDENGKAVRIDGLPPDPAVLEAQANAGKQAQRQFDQENTLRDEFQKLTGDFRIVQTSYENIRSAAKANDGAGDMSLLYNYVRLLDPTSVVRESEFAAAAASGSLGERVQTAYERIATGARMPETLRQSFIREGKNLYDNQLRSHNTVADQYEELARANGLEPKRVVTRFARPQDDAAPATPPPPPGFKVVQ